MYAIIKCIELKKSMCFMCFKKKKKKNIKKKAINDDDRLIKLYQRGKERLEYEMSFEYLINNVRNMRSHFFDNIWKDKICRYKIKHHP